MEIKIFSGKTTNEFEWYEDNHIDMDYDFNATFKTVKDFGDYVENRLCFYENFGLDNLKKYEKKTYDSLMSWAWVLNQYDQKTKIEISEN